jgi:hypothetical protein
LAETRQSAIPLSRALTRLADALDAAEAPLSNLAAAERDSRVELVVATTAALEVFEAAGRFLQAVADERREPPATYRVTCRDSAHQSLLSPAAHAHVVWLPGRAGREEPPMLLRLKFGRNPYTMELVCARCRRSFTGGGLYVRIESAGKLVDIPVCPECERTYGLFEGRVDVGRDDPSHPIGVA